MTKAGTWSIGTLALLVVFKGVAYAVSLGSFRGGPTFPALFLGAVAGLMAGQLPGFSITPAVAVGMAAAVAAVLRLPLSAIVIADVLTTGSGAGSEPLVIVGTIMAYMVSVHPARDPAPAARADCGDGPRGDGPGKRSVHLDLSRGAQDTQLAICWLVAAPLVQAIHAALSREATTTPSFAGVSSEPPLLFSSEIDSPSLADSSASSGAEKIAIVASPWLPPERVATTTPSRLRGVPFLPAPDSRSTFISSDAPLSGMAFATPDFTTYPAFCRQSWTVASLTSLADELAAVVVEPVCVLPLVLLLLLLLPPQPARVAAAISPSARSSNGCER